ncbi:MAG TPA: hypothetical protein VHV26_16550 [Rhizomicrobium sp.]|nr:hypothetical protein [Rhizomicrobium sp.]
MALPARAELSDLTLTPPDIPVGEAALRLDALAGGTVIAGGAPDGGVPASGVVKLMPRLERDYDSGLSLAVAGTFTLADPLSRGRYDGDAVEQLYGEARTGVGRLQVGMVDGAGYALKLPLPAADDEIALDDPQTTFFRDPQSHRATIDMFTLRTEVGASSNYGKIAFVSPQLFGVQVALSFTPSEGKNLPFVDAGPDVPGRQADIWEGALRYSDTLGPVSLSAYLAAAESRAEHKLPGQVGVGDLGLGLRADYPVNDDVTLSLGAAWRQSNAYAFDIARSYDGAKTRVTHVSAGVTDDAWSAALEYGNGVAGSPPDSGAARLGLNGLEASLGYALSPGIQVSWGWQHLNYGRDRGQFYNSTAKLSLDAAFMHLTLHTTG